MVQTTEQLEARLAKLPLLLAGHLRVFRGQTREYGTLTSAFGACAIAEAGTEAGFRELTGREAVGRSGQASP